MSDENAKVLSWWAIIAILIGVGFAVGLLLGLMGQMFGLSSRITGGGVGVGIGIVGASLIARRRAALAHQKKV